MNTVSLIVCESRVNALVTVDGWTYEWTERKLGTYIMP